MAEPKKKVSRTVPVLLFVLGVAGLSGGILLIPSFVEQVTAERVASIGVRLPVMPPAEVGEPAPVAPDPAEPEPAQPQAPAEAGNDAGPAAEPTEEPTAAPEAAPVAAEQAVAAGNASGPWRIDVNPEGYAIGAAGDLAVAQIAAQLKASPSARARVLGKNGSRYSSRRGKQAAREVRDRIAEQGLSKKRMWTEAEQDDTVSGFVVVVEITGGAE